MHTPLSFLLHVGCRFLVLTLILYVVVLLFSLPHPADTPPAQSPFVIISLSEGWQQHAPFSLDDHDTFPSASILTLEAYTRCVAQTLDIDEALALAVLIQESHPTDPLRIGKGNSRGPLQIKPIALEEVGLSREERSLPVLVYGGLLYLKEMLARFGNLANALAAYNMGPARLKQRDYDPYPMTQQYVSQILTRIKKIRAGSLPSYPVLNYDLAVSDFLPRHPEELQECVG